MFVKKANMTCNHCCGANRIFDEKSAKRDLRYFLKKGPRKSTARLIKQIESMDIPFDSIIDIGAGIGAVHLHFLEKGASRAVDIDASESYLMKARELAESKDLSDRIGYHHGDFIDHAIEVSPSDLVVLDKVICCYPEMTRLLNSAASKSNSAIALVYPKSNGISRALLGLMNVWFRIKGNPFRSYVHDNDQVRNVLMEGGFSRTSSTLLFPWRIETYLKRTQD